ncbi:phosphate ABC transporter substrate-binding protein [Derxia lacustris]|uniref:phosphate ABC transporter substrate-binding protein n=1 Tax=Derxia lacustris TaxID=764842 RepID=UPI000A16EAA4|nr:phosphate ABC transporter substrate-binding protein [Derxia lacustris]
MSDRSPSLPSIAALPARRRALAGGLALGVATLLPRRARAAGGGRLVLTGSSTIAPLALEIAHRFELVNPGTRVDVQSGGSSRGVADARSGAAAIGLVSRALGPTETDLTAHTIALDGVGLIVHRSNPVAALGADQVRAIYTGALRNWRELGGPDRPITVVNKAEGRSTLELFLHFYGLKNGDIRAQAVIGENEQGIKTVAGNPGAIGYVSIGSAEYDAHDGVPIRLLPIDGIAATTAHVRDRSFPLSRPLNLVTRGTPDALAARFIAYARSADVDDLVQALYFVPLAR